jgi:hypothetical protein
MTFIIKNIGLVQLIHSSDTVLDEDGWYGTGIVSIHYDGWYFFKIDYDGLLRQGDIGDDDLDLDYSYIKITGIDEI